ncbi:ComF family protein [Nesterenkonia alkaliphila]|uniref:ComF family protein n=1 Tax=Nesterenkonia alkaliphila TaxID=1463631 RepID=A0A7K1UKE7_9MICC|nr:phosphoribosyltransferase family protein [Nesterenkonia alkaliphila]MVT26894.1 ComF family protein [Nesterenkonia alkaliphila]GFZ82168.1 hypothetical protein GCM10011359_08460 [Nesterenkonia alkaliphila]
MAQHRQRLLQAADRLWFSASGTALRGLARQSADLLAPVWCLGCRAPETGLCQECAEDLRLLTAEPFRAEAAAQALPVVEVSDRGLTVLPVISAGHYQGLAAQAVVAFKDHERTALAQVLAPALGRALRAASEALLDGRTALLVWPPASPRSHLKRGRVPLTELINAAVLPDSLRRAGGLVQHTGRVWRSLGGKGQKGRSGRDRRQASGTFRLAPQAAAGIRGADILLVDDVLTTGATLQELYRLLSSAGARVQGAAVLVATPRASRAGE